MKRRKVAPRKLSQCGSRFYGGTAFGAVGSLQLGSASVWRSLYFVAVAVADAAASAGGSTRLR